MDNLSISFELDSDGFMSQECPSCAKRFKVRFAQDEDEEGKGPLAYCPYCGYHETGCWWTQEQADYIENSVAKPFEEELDKMARDFNRGNRRGGLVNIDVKRTGPTANPQKPTEPDDPMPQLVFTCHDEPVKHDETADELHCIICGKRQGVE